MTHTYPHALAPRSIRTIRLALAALFALAVLAIPVVAHAKVSATGLRGRPAKVSLVEETLQIRIDQQYATTKLQQVYRNVGSGRIEMRYEFLPPEGTRVGQFAYYNGEEKIVGKIFERAKAERVYRQITGARRDPGIVTEDEDGRISFRIFPVEGGERKPVHLTAGGWLVREDGRVKYEFPLEHEDAAVSVIIDHEQPIAELRSSTHEIAVTRLASGRLRVRTKRARGEAAKFRLSYAIDDAPWHITHAVHAERGDDAFVVFTVAVPKQIEESAISAKDVTLVIDRSGSMFGARMDNARAAAAEIVGRLSPRDSVNVVAFNSNTETLYDGPRQTTPNVRKQTIRYIERLDVEGGTDIAAALKVALRAKSRSDRPHVVLLLTDGDSDNHSALLAATEHGKNVRVYTIGVGDEVNRVLLSRIARLKNGRFTYIQETNEIESEMARLYTSLASPVLVSPTIEVEGAVLRSMYPRSLPDLYRGDELRVVARLMGDGPVKVRVRGKKGGHRLELARTVRVKKEDERTWVRSLWGASRVEDLLEQIALYGETPEQRESVVRLAKEHQLVTPYTAFLAIPESELTASVRAQLEAPPKGFREARAGSGLRNALPNSAPSAAASAPQSAMSAASVPRRSGKTARDRSSTAKKKRKSRPRRSSKPSASPRPSAPVESAGSQGLAKAEKDANVASPTVQIAAPANAKFVQLRFSFGLELELSYNAKTKRWVARLPRNVPRGKRSVEVLIVKADGTKHKFTTRVNVGSGRVLTIPMR